VKQCTEEFYGINIKVGHIEKYVEKVVLMLVLGTLLNKIMLQHVIGRLEEERKIKYSELG